MGTLQRSPRFFYGWLITAAAGVGLCFGYAGSVIYGFSSFVLPLSAEFGWSRRDIGLAFGKVYSILFAVYSLGVGLAAPLSGWSYDQSGSYVEMLVVGALVNLLAVILILTLGRYPHLPVQETIENS